MPVCGSRGCALAAEGRLLERPEVGKGARLLVERVVVCRAAGGGYLEVLKWARGHGCQWEENIYDNPYLDCCALAARLGHLEVLKWAREQHCPWDANVRVWPLRAGTWRCLSMRGITAARGTRSRVVHAPLRAGTWSAEVGAGAPLPVGRTEAPKGRAAGTAGAVTVGGGARCSLRRAYTALVASDALSAALSGCASVGRSSFILIFITSRFRALLQLNILLAC